VHTIFARRLGRPSLISFATPPTLAHGVRGDLPVAATRKPQCPDTTSSAYARSGGYGEVKVTHAPVPGWVNDSSTAWSHWRTSPSLAASTGSAP